jgi:hypothetical protein
VGRRVGWRVPPSGKAELDNRIVIPLPAVYGGVIERPLIDVSQSGVAFRSLPGDPLFLPGTPLGGVVIVRDSRASPPRAAEVRQVVAEDGDGQRVSGTFRVGVALGDAVREHDVAERASDGDGVTG